MGIRKDQLLGMLKTYVADTTYGVALYTAMTEEGARMAALREVGSMGFNSIRLAKQSDIDWIKAMNGNIPKGAKACAT